MKFIEESIQVILNQKGLNGTHKFSCNVMKKEHGYTVIASTTIDGKKAIAQIPYTDGLQKAESLPTEDFELTVTV